ncbi:MAG: glycerate kinase [bacterium]|nr:glycerate kinase [bacterium]
MPIDRRGTLDALVDATGGRVRRVQCVDPLGRPSYARIGVLGDGVTAVVEMAEASGLARLTAAERDPERTTTLGTGELVRAALDGGARTLVVAIGGSATNDGGAGLLAALGARLLDAEDRPLPPGGAALARLARVDLSGLDPRLAGVRLRVACDVDNPLCGPHGASRVFGPQKGADPAAVERLDAALARYGAVLARAIGRDVATVAGSGAAGGLGAGLLACGAELERGVDLVLDTLRFDEHLRGAAWVFTGEGRLDAQTAGGKTIAGVVARAKRAGVPAIAFAGALAKGWEALLDRGLVAAFGIGAEPRSVDASLLEGPADLERTVAQVVRTIAAASGG